MVKGGCEGVGGMCESDGRVYKGNRKVCKGDGVVFEVDRMVCGNYKNV